MKECIRSIDLIKPAVFQMVKTSKMRKWKVFLLLTVCFAALVTILNVTLSGLFTATKHIATGPFPGFVLSGCADGSSSWTEPGDLDNKILEIMKRCLLKKRDLTLREKLIQAEECLRSASSEVSAGNDETAINENDTERLDTGYTCLPVANQTTALYPLSVERETARRRVESTAREVFYFVNAQLDTLSSKNFDENGSQQQFAASLRKDLQDYKMALTNDLHALRHVDKDEEWRVRESRELAQLVHQRLHTLQNPRNCSEARILVCNVGRRDGFSSLLHEATMCLLTAYAVRRTLVLTTNGWGFAPSTWDTFMLPVSGTCTANDTKDMDPKNQTPEARIVEWKSVIGNWLYSSAKFIPRTIPADLAKRLKAFHGDPSVWWFGQLVRYLLRPQPHLEQTIKAQAERLGFESPTVGIQVRRTDKVNRESKFYAVEEYMQHVQEYYDTREQREQIKQRRLFVATDDPSVFTEIQNKYPQYNIIRVEGNTESSSVDSRRTKDGLMAILVDLHLLSMCDFVVCTYSSNICRAVNELIQTRNGDASQKVYSLDSSVYFVTYGDIYYGRAVINHEQRSPEEISLQRGDLVHIQPYLFFVKEQQLAGNLRNGLTVGINKRTGKKGLFPSFKVVEDIVEEIMACLYLNIQTCF